MSKGISIIGGVAALVIAGGVFAYKGQNDETVYARDVSTSFATSTRVALAETTVAPPMVTTKDATRMTASTATLHGIIGSKGVETTYWFEYSSDPLLGQILNRRTPRVLLNSDTNRVSVDEDVSSLSSSTTYYYRMVVESSSGVVRGDRATFRTI